MRSLSQKTLDRLSAIAAEIEKTYDAMDERLAAAVAEIEAMREQADALRDEAFQLLDDAHCQADDYYSDRSERWRDGDKGQAYFDWMVRLETPRDDLDSLPEIELGEIARPDFIGDLLAEDFAEPEEVW